MTDSDEHRVPAACAEWLAAHDEWAPVPGCRYYEASHRASAVRSIDRTVNGRRLRSVTLKATPNNDGYPIVGVTDDDGNRVKKTVHSLVMLAHAGACPPGLEIRHLNSDPADSRYCGCGWTACTEGNVVYGTKLENHADMVAAGTALVPEFECINFARCGGTTRNPGRRCGACVEQVGRFAAQLLNAGMPSMEAAERFGYSDDRWLHRLAAEQGGYKGTRAEARTQSPTLLQRVQILGILRLARRAGLLRSDAA